MKTRTPALVTAIAATMLMGAGTAPTETTHTYVTTNSYSGVTRLAADEVAQRTGAQLAPNGAIVFRPARTLFTVTIDDATALEGDPLLVHVRQYAGSRRVVDRALCLADGRPRIVRGIRRDLSVHVTVAAATGARLPVADIGLGYDAETCDFAGATGGTVGELTIRR